METRYLLNGPAHVVKNVCGSIRSTCRTIHVGRYWCDCSAALDMNLPPGAYIGYDAQSDRECATLLNGHLANCKDHTHSNLP